jgi:Fe2+ transport system protein FeoA
VSSSTVSLQDHSAKKLFRLSQVGSGVAVTIKQLSADPDVNIRLRELGFCEEQRIKLLSHHTNIICQVCNARLGISRHLADVIWVEPLANVA